MIKRTKIDRARAGEDPTHDPYVDHAHYFVGNVNVQGLVGTDESGEVGLLAVFFAAGARTRPHIHERDQILLFTEGQGIVATETEKYQASPGDVFTIPAGTWHWHGAARDASAGHASAGHASACHISIRRPGQTNWDVEERNWASGYEE